MFKYSVTFILSGAALFYYAVQLSGWYWLLLWPGIILLLVGIAYAGAGPGIFGKRPDGSMSLLNIVLLLPYLLFTWSLWHIVHAVTREDKFNRLTANILIGRRLLAKEYPEDVGLIVDLTCEFPEPKNALMGRDYLCLPTLDAGVPDKDALEAVLKRVQSEKMKIYIHCAEGHGRTGTIAASLLLTSGKVSNATEAVEHVTTARPGVKLRTNQRTMVERFVSG